MTRVSRAALAAVLSVALVAPAAAQDRLSAEMHAVSGEGIGESVGTIVFTDSEHGLMIEPALQGVPAGLHGLHVHQNADCGPGQDERGETIAAGAAGGHLDPEVTGRHEGPYGDGHMGDLPNLMVMEDGTATLPLLAPRLAIGDLVGRAIVIHAEADSYTDDHPGGGRTYCGIVG